MNSEELQEYREKRLKAAFLAVLNTPVGREVLSFILYDQGGRESGIGTGQFAGSIKDGVAAYGHQSFLAGRHDLALDIEKIVQTVSIDQWLQMRREYDEAQVLLANLVKEENDG